MNNSLSLSQTEEEYLLSDDSNPIHGSSCTKQHEGQSDAHNSIVKFSAIRSTEEDTTFMSSAHGPKSKDRGNTVKSCKKLLKDKEQFLKYDPKIQRISLSKQVLPHKIDELASLIESQKLLSNQKRLKCFISEIIEVTEDLACQKKNLQRELDNVVSLNKVMALRLKEVTEYFSSTKSEWSRIGSCPQSIQFSKNKQSPSPINQYQDFQFEHTVIDNIEGLQLKRVEEQEQFNRDQMKLVELLWFMKNKAAGSTVPSVQSISKGFSGPTLISWVKAINEKISNVPKISDFDADLDFSNMEEPCIMEEFIQVLEQHQDHYIQNISKSLLPARQSEFLRYSTLMTFIQILNSGRGKLTKEEAMNYFGRVNRQLCLIQKRTNTEISGESEGRRAKVEDLIDGLF